MNIKRQISCLLLFGLGVCSMVSVQNNLSQVEQLIVDLDSFYDYQNLFIYIPNDFDDHNLLKLLQNKITRVIINSDTSLSNINFSKLFRKQSFALIVLQNLHNINHLNAVDATLRTIHDTKLLFILDFEIPGSKSLPETLEWIFKWCWDKKFLNVIVMLNRNLRAQKFSYSPFPQFHIENVTNLDYMNLYPNKLKNLKGFKVRAAINYDPPRVFAYINDKGEEIFTGPMLKLFNEFFKFLNATTSDKLSTEYFDLDKQIFLLNNFSIDFAYVICPKLTESLNKISISKEPFQGGATLLVPYAKEIEKSSYFILPFNNFVWLCFLFLLVYLTLMDTISSYLYVGKFDIGRSMCKTISAMLYVSFWKREKLEFRRVLVFVQVFLLGFILTTIYLTYLSSFLASGVYEKQIDTFDDIVSAKLHIMVPHSLFAYTQSIELPDDFAKRIIGVDTQTYFNKKYELNTSYGYITVSGSAQLTLLQQIYLRRPLVRLASQILAPVQYGIPLHLDSPFANIFDRFISLTVECGLYGKKWTNDHYQHLIKAQVINFAREDEVQDVGLTPDHFSMAFYILMSGYLLSFCIFLIENMTHKMVIFNSI